MCLLGSVKPFGKYLLGLPYLFLLCRFVILVVSHFGFEGRTLVLITPVPGHCLPFTFDIISELILVKQVLPQPGKSLFNKIFDNL